MKKFLMFVFLSVIALPVMADVNMPGKPSFGTSSNVKTEVTNSHRKDVDELLKNNPNIKIPEYTPPVPEDSTKAKLDSLALSVLKAAENYDTAGQNKYIKEMIEAGAEGFSTPQIISKKTPTCPPIKIKVNGRQLSGSKCALFGYLYKDKQYDVGYCK